MGDRSQFIKRGTMCEAVKAVVVGLELEGGPLMRASCRNGHECSGQRAGYNDSMVGY